MDGHSFGSMDWWLPLSTDFQGGNVAGRVYDVLSSIIPKRTYLNICRNSTLNIIHAEGVKSPIGFM